MNALEFKPILVQNSYVNKTMNVEPLFRMVQERGELAENIDAVIRIIITSNGFKTEDFYVPEPFFDLSDAFSFLYNMRDALAALEKGSAV